jgi:integrase
VRDGLLAKNPAAAVKRPGIARREARHASAVDVNKLLLSADGLRYRNVLVLIAATGLRRGEALALRWSDVDPARAVLVVRGTLGRVGGRLLITEPKTDRSRRTLPISPALVTMLQAHRADQEAERIAARDKWQDRGLVFASVGDTGRSAKYSSNHSDRRTEGWNVRHWRAHVAAQCCRRLA